MDGELQQLLLLALHYDSLAFLVKIGPLRADIECIEELSHPHLPLSYISGYLLIARIPLSPRAFATARSGRPAFLPSPRSLACTIQKANSDRISASRTGREA
ncbi:hypothetical protein SDC9_136549 [bioreactor metagenome]|uniref:Uncharacterized protein n=1 Tax=bioreactor metagenome TaxID=1076179 RepID=A0A645DIZ0_9ZZZZ